MCWRIRIGVRAGPSDEVTFEQRPEWGEPVREGVLGRDSSSESAVLVTPLRTPREAHGWIAMEGLRG